MRQSLKVDDPYGSRLMYTLDKLNTTELSYDIPKSHRRILKEVAKRRG